MSSPGALIREDFLSTAFLLVVIWIIGSRTVTYKPSLEQRGWRVSLLVFVVYTIWSGFTRLPEKPIGWAGIAVESLFVAGFTLGLSWIAFALLSLVFEQIVRPPIRAISDFWTGIRRRQRGRRAARDAERLRRLEQEAYERSKPDRERVRLQAEAEARARSVAMRRREDARAQALLHYRLYAARLGDKMLPKPEFDAYLQTFMGDAQPPDIVERRGRELVAHYERLVGDCRPVKSVRTLETLTNWYRGQKSHIEGLDLDDIVRQTLLSNLNQRYQELLDSYLAEVEP